MNMGVESMEKAPGAIPRPGRVPEQRLLSPQNWSLMVAALRNFLWMEAGPFRVFASEAFYCRKSNVRGHPRGPHHTVAWLEGGAPPYGVAASVPSSISSLDSVFVSGKNRRFGFCFVQFREYFMYNFYEIQK
jgi:hypothetical protein